MKHPAISRGKIASVLHYSVAFALAMALMVVPAPEYLLVYRPDFVALVLIYFCWHYSDFVGVITAFFVGLLVDVLTFGIMGQHALAKVIVAYCCIRFTLTMNQSSPFIQALSVLVLLAVHSTIIYLVRLYTNEGSANLALWLSVFTGAALWFLIESIKQFISPIRNVTAK